MSAPTTQVFRLPDLGEGLTEAEVVAWHVAVGDEVGIDQEVVTVETAKAAVDVPCPFAGAVAELHAQPGTVLAVGSPLITIASGGAGMPSPAPADPSGEQYRTEERAGATPPTASDDAPERPLIGYGAGDGPQRRQRGQRRRPPSPPSPRSAPQTTPPSPRSAPETTPPSPRSAHTGSGAVRVISPLVRRLAKDYGIDLATVRPGPTGVVRRADLEAARATEHNVFPVGVDGVHTASSVGVDDVHSVASVGVDHVHNVGSVGVDDVHSVASVGVDDVHNVGSVGGDHVERRVPIQGVQRIMVDRLTTSRRVVPDATTWVDVDATGLLRAKDALRSAYPDAGIGVLPLMARIVVAGLRRFPALNSSVDLDAGEIVHHGAVNLGFAAQSPRGLVVPVVHGASALTLKELAAALRELTVGAREGTLTPAQMSGGTFTLNNYGVYGVDGSTPIINHPEAGMLGVGRIVDKPWVHKGRLRVRKVTQLGFTFDHRVCDGGTAGGFLRYVADCVERPTTLLADL